MKYTLDRFEEQFAVLESETGDLLQIPKSELPIDAAEGCCLQNADGKWHLADNADTIRRIKNKMDILWK